jgi:hypothetical protein
MCVVGCGLVKADLGCGREVFKVEEAFEIIG